MKRTHTPAVKKSNPECQRIGGCLHGLGHKECCCDDNSCDSQAQPKPHDPCPICSCNVHGRVTVALDYLKKGQVAKAKAELEMMLPLTQP